MAKNNRGEILASGSNPVVGCQRDSSHSRDCRWLDGIIHWQKRLGNVPAPLVEGIPFKLDARDCAQRHPKKSIVGFLQHGDLFLNGIPDATIDRVLDVVDEAAREHELKNARLPGRSLDTPKFLLWTKRADRMADYMSHHYPEGVPSYIACGVPLENQMLADERLPHLLRIQGNRFVMIEPMLGPIDLSRYANVHWIVLGSETGFEK